MNFGINIQILKLFYECDLHVNLISSCETSKQLEHKKLRCYQSENVFFSLILMKIPFQSIHLEILHWYIGLKCQLIINLDTHKFFTFTIKDGHSTNVSLKLSCCVSRKIFGDFSGFAFGRFPVNHFNKLIDCSSRPCNTDKLIGWEVE